MKKLLVLTGYLFAATAAFCQGHRVVDKVRVELAAANTDSARISGYIGLAGHHRFSDKDSALYYANKAIDLSKLTKNIRGEALSRSMFGFILLETGDIPTALQFQFEALRIAQTISDKYIEGLALNRIGNIYMELQDYRQAIDYYKRSELLFAKTGYKGKPADGWVMNEVSNIGNIYEMMGELDSAKILQQQVYRFSQTHFDRDAITYGELRERLGNIEFRLKNYDTALMHYHAGIHEALYDNDIRNLAAIYLQMSRLFLTTGRYDSAFLYANKTIESGREVSWKKAIWQAAEILAAIYKGENKQADALRYTELAYRVKDSLYGPEQIRQLQLVTLKEQQRQQKIIDEKEAMQLRYRFAAVLFLFTILLAGSILLWRNNKQRRKTNNVLLAQKNQLETALTKLKDTQTQLVQSEKMASLGELTAGIAHEIQNPLNFVNNFSEVSIELVEELKAETSASLTHEHKLLDNISDNLGKIVHHGKRADSIVKGMLQHSRSSTGKKEAVDINNLVDEYLRLSYHGLRAKDKSFNAEMETSYDPLVGLVPVLPQDLGRVFLNLFTNAFYSVSQKMKTAGSEYKPMVRVKTKRKEASIEIVISDNGTGISQTVIDKIFQPFFTTKPTGEGTGLGLSLSYDIITKGHGGKLEVLSTEGESASFKIILAG